MAWAQTDERFMPSDLRHRYVPESRFGLWFLATDIWVRHVLEVAIRDLERHIIGRHASYPTIVDVGCGYGRAFKILTETFAARRLIGVDVDPRMIAAAAAEADRLGLAVELRKATSAQLPIHDSTVDMVFCHQTFHHLVDQEGAVREFYRVLKPGGLLLFAESTRAYIHSWIIRWLFRHPMHVQRSAPQYLQMIEQAGFYVDPRSISYPYLWWSRPDLGIGESWLGIKPPDLREETLINLVAVRP